MNNIRREHGSLQIRVLGSLAAENHSRSITPTAPKPRAVLAMLILNANEVVSMASLVEEIWGKSPPRNAKTIIQTYVLGIRKLLRAAEEDCADGSGDAKRLLATTPGRYVLNVPAESVDVYHFERLGNAGHRAWERNDFESAAECFAAALSWWRGPALMDVCTGPNLGMAATRLDEAHLNLLDCRIDADLRLGRHHELMGEVLALSGRYPTHEGLAAHLMLALYRSGRRCDALEVYQRLHTTLVKDKGLEPAPPLRRLHKAMLIADRQSNDLIETWPAANGQDRQGTDARARLGLAAVRRNGISAELATIPWRSETTQKVF